MPTNATPGFGCEIKCDTDLGGGILMAEFADGHYQPIAVVLNINEAREIADSNIAWRRRKLETKLTGLKLEHALPQAYVVWARGLEGDYREVPSARFDQ